MTEDQEFLGDEIPDVENTHFLEVMNYLRRKVGFRHEKWSCVGGQHQLPSRKTVY